MKKMFTVWASLAALIVAAPIGKAHATDTPKFADILDSNFEFSQSPLPRRRRRTPKPRRACRSHQESIAVRGDGDQPAHVASGAPDDAAVAALGGPDRLARAGGL